MTRLLLSVCLIALEILLFSFVYLMCSGTQGPVYPHLCCASMPSYLQPQSRILNMRAPSPQATYCAPKGSKVSSKSTCLVLVDFLVLLLVLLTGLLCLLPVAVVTRFLSVGELVLILGTSVLHVLAVARGNAVSVSVGRWEDRRALVSVTALVSIAALRRRWSRAVLIVAVVCRPTY